MTKQSVFDWSGFKIVEEKKSKSFDPLIDYDNLTPFFKSICEQIDTDKKNGISKDEMQKALKDKKIAWKLSRLICKHPSEWWTDAEFVQWKRLLKLAGRKHAKVLKERLKNLCWWDEVASKVKNFPSKPNVYHFHPVGFVEQMRK